MGKTRVFQKGDIYTLEIPLDGNVFTQSLYTTKTRNGVFTRTLSDVSMKLVIQKHKRTNELRYFIVTIINREQASSLASSQASHPVGYIHHPELEGLMIISDIEGNYLDAFLYSNGVNQRVALAKVAGMDVSTIEPEYIIGAISMSATNNPGIYSRAGESGGGGTVYCALCGKANCNGDCEILVTYCKKCNRPISTCQCCPTCHNYPCSCYTPPVWRCPKCGSSLCPGDCQTSGGGSQPSTTVTPPGDLSKKIFSNDSK